MRRAPVGAPRVRATRACSLRPVSLVAALVTSASLAISGCGGREESAPQDMGFEFETAPDSAALAGGRPLLADFEPYRASDGALRVRGRFDLPDGARLQISVKRRSDGTEVGREQVLLVRGGFDTPPIPSSGAALPEDDYRFDISTEFNRVWQPANVLSATRSGLSLTGPGMRRGARGEAIYRLTVEKRL